MSVLTISVSDLRRLAGIDSSDTSQDAALQAVRDAEQLVIEYQLDPAALTASATDPGLLATLVLGVGEILAGRYLQQYARSPGALDDFKVGVVQVSASAKILDLAQQLSQHGAALIAPWGRTGVSTPIFANARTAAEVSALRPLADILPSPPSSDGAAGSLSVGLFGVLQGSSIGTTDAEPPAEFGGD